MKKLLIFILAISAVSLTSCLKDTPNTDFSLIKGQAVVELPYAGLQYFSLDAVTDAGDTVVKKFGINVASATPLSTDTKYTLAVDYSLMTAYQATNAAVTYEQMPEGSYSISKTAGTIKAGQRLDSVTVTFYKSKMDPTHSYMLPIKLASASNGILSGNFNAHYYHFIGNDFGGTYKQVFRRWNASDSTSTALNSNSFGPSPVTFLPVSKTEFTVKGGYAASLVSYDVTFTKNADGTYSNFAVQMLPSDLTVLAANSLTVIQAPVFLVQPPDNITKAQAIQYFRFQWIAGSGGNPRYLADIYY